MSGLVKLSVLAGACLAMVACSNNHGAPTPVASTPAASTGATAPAASAIPMQAPASGASSAAPIAPSSHGPALSVILQRPSFAKAFADMDGASSLPAWVKTSDASAPSTRVQVSGKTLFLAQICGPAGCAADEVLLLADLPAQAMQGVYVQDTGTAGASVQKLTWLGKPDAATQAFLKGQLTHD